tara:strand:+ start:21080 stop:21292 length:213 start_codon:yes stop_codon:yes gene_type:complete
VIDVAELLDVLLTHAGSSVAIAVLAVVSVGEGFVIKYLLQDVKELKDENSRRTERVDEILDHFMRKSNGE